MSTFVALRNRDNGTLHSLIQRAQKKDKRPIDLNAKNLDGETALLRAVTLQNVEAVRLLVDCPIVNMNIQDTESGYTALHRALYSGYLAIALEILKRKDCDLQLRDHEGNTCLDLLNSTIDPPPLLVHEDSPESSPKQSRRSLFVQHVKMSVWTWGKNCNYLLGHPSSDDWSIPEKVELPVGYKSGKPVKASLSTLPHYMPTIRKVLMSKYHSCVLTEQGLLYVCGFGPGGRLGLGDEETTMNFRLVPVTQKVSDVALGADHTVIVTSEGTVWTCGINRYGQLGYTCDPSKPVLSCREVSGSLKKLRVKLAAASKFHTVICTENQLFTWGHNNGQLGYVLPLGSVQAFPKKVAIPCDAIIQISATNSATAVLSKSKDVYVYAQGEWQKVLFPTLYNNISTKFHAPIQQKYHRIIKLTSGNHQFAAINAQGDVYLWSPPEDHRFADTWQQQTFPQRKPKIIWAIRKKYLAARDVAVGIDSSILIRTDSGHVYYGVRREEVKVRSVKKQKDVIVYFKYLKVPHLQHIEAVGASISGGFCAIRKDLLTREAYQRPFTLSTDLENMIVDSESLQRLSGLRNSSNILLSSGQKHYAAHQAILSSRSDFFRQLFSQPESVHLFSGVTVSEVNRVKVISFDGMEEHVLPCLLKLIYSPVGNISADVSKWARLLQIHDSRFFEVDIYRLIERQDHDVIIQLKDRAVTAHQVIICARCPFFNAMLKDHSRWNLTMDQGIYTVHLSHFQWKHFEIALKFMYSDATPLFNDPQEENLGLYVQFVMDVMSMADELLLEELKNICADVLCHMIDTASVIDFLEFSYEMDSDLLKQACLSFETMVEGRRLIHLPLFVLQHIEARLREIQNEKFRFTRGPEGMYMTIRKKVQQEEQEKKAMRRQLFAEQHHRPVESGLSSSPRIFLPSSHEQVPLLLSASPSFAKSPAVRKVSNSPACTMIDRPPLSSRASDDIFEMEMDLVEPLDIKTYARKNDERHGRFDSQETLVDIDIKSTSETRKQKSLLDIMQEEQIKKEASISSQSLKSTKSPSIALLTGSFPNIRIKSEMSQRARKRSAHIPQLSPLAISPKTNPWVSLGTSNASSPRFRDIQQEEERAMAASRLESSSTRTITPTTQLSTSPWGKCVAHSPPLSFMDIQSEQLKALQKMKERPKLSFAQILEEERRASLRQ